MVGISSTSVPRAATGDGTAATAALTPPTATRLLVRAIGLARGKQDDDEWLNASTVKSQIKRLDPSFSEKALGHKSFSEFVKAHPGVAEVDESGNIVLIRLAADRR